jgi:hypothetical protein
MQSHSLFSKFKARINDYNAILKKCEEAIIILKKNIETIDTELKRVNENKAVWQDTLAVKSILMRKRIEEVNKKNNLEKMLVDQPIDSLIPLKHFQYSISNQSGRR